MPKSKFVTKDEAAKIIVDGTKPLADAVSKLSERFVELKAIRRRRLDLEKSIQDRIADIPAASFGAILLAELRKNGRVENAEN